MKNTDELQKRLLGAYLANPDLASASPIAGRLAELTTGKWRTLAAHIDSIILNDRQATYDAVIQRIIETPYEGPSGSFISPEEVQDLPGSKSEATVSGYEAQLCNWNRQKSAGVILKDYQLRIAPSDGTITDPSSLIADLVDALRRVDSRSGADVNVGSGLHEAVDQAERNKALLESGGPTATWGLGSLDSICPLEPGRMITLAAAPKCGKTSLAMMAAAATAKAGGKVAFASLEMRASELATVMAARVLGFNTREFRKGRLPQEDISTIRLLADEWKQQNSIIIRDTRSDAHRCADIASWCRQRARMFDGITLIVIDYLQLMASGNDRKSEYDTVTANTRTLKLLATSLHVPILLLSQMNREGRKSQMDGGQAVGQIEPTMGSLRSSGSIEQDSDAVCFLWSSKTPEPGETHRHVQFKLEASRYCEPGRRELMFYGPQQTFSDAFMASPVQPAHQSERLRQPIQQSEDLFNENAK